MEIDTDEEDQQIKRIQKLREVNSILMRTSFSHHPNCSEYDHHVIQLGSWRLCLGCTAMYSGILITAIVDLLIVQGILEITPVISIALGILFFLPAVYQLVLASENRKLRFVMRFSLGISVYYILRFIITVDPWWMKIISGIFFLFMVRYYSRYQGDRQLRECVDCRLGQEYHTCTIKYQALIGVEDLYLIEENVPQIKDLLAIQSKLEGESEVIGPLHNNEVE